MKRILFVDDNAHMREAFVDIVALMAPNQFEVLTARNGRDGLEIILRENSIFALITDFNMPLMNGDELINEIASKNVPLDRIIVISGNPANEATISNLNLPNYRITFLSKPFPSHKLISLLKN